MRSLRGNRKASGKARGSQDEQVQTSVGSRVTSTYTSRTAKLIESSMSDLSSLGKVIESVSAYPAQLQTDAFNVFFQHLQTPVEQQLCERGDPYAWVMVALTGIRRLGCTYFERDDIHKKRLIKCWPHIFKWLKALLTVRDIWDTSKAGLFSTVAGQIFDVAHAICRSVFEDDDVLVFAVRAWIGVGTPDGKDYYTGQCLLSCLSVLIVGEDTGAIGNRVKSALLACDIDAGDLIGKLVERFKHATIGASSSNKFKEAMILINLMVNLVLLRQSFFVSATLNPSVGLCFASLLKTLVDGSDQSTERGHRILTLLTIVDASLKYRSDAIKYAIALVEAGILIPLFKIASDPDPKGFSVNKDHTVSSVTARVLRQLLRCLICDDMVAPCRRGLLSLYDGQENVEDLLESSPKLFRDFWIMFEALVLEFSILLRLFESCFAPEEGICTNCACRRVCFRGEFKKCEGCLFALYCSRSCQKADWRYHRIGCMTINDSARSALNDRSSRFLRKFAALQVNRFWEQIVMLAGRRDVPLCNAAVEFDCKEIPFEVGVFDFHTLFEESEKERQLTLAAREMWRQSEENRRGWIIVILSLPEKKIYPCLVRLDDACTRSVSDGLISKLQDSLDEREPRLFIDHEGDVLSCEKVDALRAGVQLAKKYAADLGESVWSEDVLAKATRDVLGDFQDVIGSFESEPALGPGENNVMGV